MNKFMKRAVELAVQNVKEGGQPFGAVIVKNDKIVAEAVNETHLHYDVSGHAELLALRKLQKQLRTFDLSGYTMYASGHPCPMCLTAMYFSKITTVYYSATLEDCKAVGLEISGQIYEDLTRPNRDRKIVMQAMPLTREMEDPLKLWNQTR